MKRKGYVLVRFENGVVEPTVICQDRYVSIGSEVMTNYGDTAIVVSAIEGYLHPEEEIAKISELFGKEPDDLVRIIGEVSRTYWEEENDAEKE